MSHQVNLHDGTGIIASVPGYGIVIAAGITMPADGGSGYAPGCVFIHVDGGDGSALYVNEGTASACDFNLITVAAA